MLIRSELVTAARASAEFKALEARTHVLTSTRVEDSSFQSSREAILVVSSPSQRSGIEYAYLDVCFRSPQSRHWTGQPARRARRKTERSAPNDTWTRIARTSVSERIVRAPGIGLAHANAR